MLGYRYSTSGYHDFSEANGDGYSNWSTGHQDKEERRAYEAWRGKYTKRSRTQANINQSLGDYGSLYLSVYEQQYWGGDRDRNVNAGFNTSHNDINYSLSYGYAQTSHFSSSDQTVSLSVQIPLSRFLPGSWLSASATSNKRGDTTLMTGLSGTALADINLSWSVMQGYNSQNANTTGSAAADYKVEPVNIRPATTIPDRTSSSPMVPVVALFFIPTG